MLPLLALLACTDATDTAAPTDDGLADCLALWTDQTTEPDADGPDTQIHGTSAFGGGLVWVAWNLPNDSSTFDVWLAGVGCDGATVVGPLAVTESPDNETDPAVAVSGDRVLVAWTASGAEMDIRYRLYDLDGAPVTEVTDLVASRGGVEVTGNIGYPAVAAAPDGFALAGSWGHDDAPAFQAFSLTLSPDGAVLGEAEDAELDTEYGQTAVALAADGGEIALAWQEDSTTSTQPSAWMSEGGAVTALADPGARPSLAFADDGLWSAWDTDGGAVWVRDPAGGEFELDLGGFAHTARVASAGDGALAVAMTVESGVYNAVHLAQLDAGGAESVLALDTSSAPSVYPVDVTPVGPDHAVVVWQDGENPAFRLRMVWVTLE